MKAYPQIAISTVDVVVFGDSSSESKHELVAESSEVVNGVLDEPARRLLPVSAERWEGGKVSFKLKVDPQKPNYFTAKFWGSESSPSRLVLFCDGKQIGYRHLGDIDILDFGSEGQGGGYLGRFYYNTTPLPLEMTRGKSELQFEIRSSGRIWGYGATFDIYQKPMAEPSRAIYRASTHTDGFYAPATDEKQGAAPLAEMVRQSPGPEVLDRVKSRVNKEIDQLLSSKNPLNQMQLQFLARAYHIEWTRAYRNPEVVRAAIAGLDKLAITFRTDRAIAQNGPATYNPEWFGLGPCGDVLHLLREPVQPLLDALIDAGGGVNISRKEAYADMLVASRDWHTRHRRQYTNQSMIKDLYVFAAHRGVAAVDPDRAKTDAKMLRYLYESIGIQPWLGSDTDDGPSRSMGDHFYQLTQKGLSRELGYVGYYGEVLDWVSQIYDVSRPSPDQPGDPKIKAQLIKIALARAAFRYPALDADGNRAMRIEAVVGWRDAHYPGDVVYAQRPSWDGTATQAAAQTLDLTLIAFAQQMFDDNQFFKSVENSLKGTGLRVTAGLLDIPDEYDVLKSQPKTDVRLPMTDGQPDFVFSDEEDGVVAIKNGKDVLYASLYWRARYGINNLARVHYLTPTIDRIAVVRQETEFEPSGMWYTRPNHVNFGFGNGGPKYPAEMISAHAGEKLPIAKIPAGVKFSPGNENLHAGKGDFYTSRYGPYTILMNCATSKTFTFRVPANAKSVRNLGSRQNVRAGTEIKIEPRSTVVLFATEPNGRDSE